MLSILLYSFLEFLFFSMIQLDTAVLQFQNQKLTQKLEAQKVESRALENKFSQLKEKQQPYDSTLKVVKESWEGVLALFVSFFMGYLYLTSYCSQNSGGKDSGLYLTFSTCDNVWYLIGIDIMFL